MQLRPQVWRLHVTSIARDADLAIARRPILGDRRRQHLTGSGARAVVQTPTVLVVLNEHDALAFRQIFLDGRAHPQDLDPTWQGHAVGRWDGDTLVVDVAGFNEESVMGFAPHTSQLQVTERYRRRDYGHLEVQVTAEDPGTLIKPWTLNMVWDLAPDQEILEYVCAENIRNVHLDWAPTPSRR